MKSGNLNFLAPSGPLQVCNWTALPLPLTFQYNYTDVFSHVVKINKLSSALKAPYFFMRASASKLHTQGLIMRKPKQVEVNGPVPKVYLSRRKEYHVPDFPYYIRLTFRKHSTTSRQSVFFGRISKGHSLYCPV